MQEGMSTQAFSVVTMRRIAITDTKLGFVKNFIYNIPIEKYFMIMSVLRNFRNTIVTYFQNNLIFQMKNLVFQSK